MSETKEECKGISQKYAAELYEEVINDGKVYYPIRELQEMNLILQCSRKNGVVITGPSGSGKTALVHCFAQQDLQELFDVPSIKIVRIKPIWTIQRMDIDVIKKTIFSVLENLKASSLILYAEFNNVDLLKSAIEVMNLYLEDIKERYNMGFLKFIFEFTKTSKTDMEPIRKAMKGSCEILNCVQEDDIDLFMDRLLPRVDELSKKYGVNYTRDTVMYYVIVQAGWSDFHNLNSFIDVVEKAFIMSKRNGKTSLDKEIAKLIFPRTFENLANTPKEALRNTARHEAGHTLIELINDKRWNISFVSIVPGDGFFGVTAMDKQKKVYSYYQTKEYFLMEIAVDLAGRIAENMLDKEVKPNAGASADLKAAMNLINEIVSKYGFFEELGKNYVFLDKDVISQRNIEAIENEKRKLLESAQELAINLIFEHSDFVEKLADKLCEELVVFNYQVYDMWNEHLAHKNNGSAGKKQG